jgi:hypothetical protein
MSEGLEVRRQPVARTLGIPPLRADPVVRQRPAMPSEIPRAARLFLRIGVSAGWSAQAFFALGWRVDTDGKLTGQLSASVLIRMRRGAERLSALWSSPWPIPAGIEPPGLDTPPELASHLPRFGVDMAERVAMLRAERVAKLKTNPVVKWVYEGGAYWVRPASPLASNGRGARHGWWSATELKTVLTSPPR